MELNVTIQNVLLSTKLRNVYLSIIEIVWPQVELKYNDAERPQTIKKCLQQYLSRIWNSSTTSVSEL